MAIDVDGLRAFVAFASHLNFTHAAEELHISQPALHAKVGELSRSLGAVLYVRRGRRLELTPQGDEVARFGRELGDRLDGFLAGFSLAEAPVVLASGQGAFRFLLGPALREYLERGSLQLRVLAGEEAVLSVREGTAHVAVAALPAQAGLSSRLVRSVGHVAAVPRGHRLASLRRPLRASDLEGEGLIVPGRGRPHRQALEAVLSDWKVAVEVSGWELTLDFVALGLGVAVVNDFCPLPAGVVARPFVGLEPVEYRAFFRSDYLRREARELVEVLAG